MTSPNPPTGESLAGLIERVTFHNPENGFSVLQVKVPKRKELATVVGYLAAPTPGEHVEGQGRWTVDARHGPQFQAANLQSAPPTSAEGIERFLASGAVRGIRASLAGRIVALFGDKTLDILENSPSLLRDVSGVGANRLKMIKSSWAQLQSVRQLMLFLHQHGIGSAGAMRIHRVYGDRAISIIRANPYQLADDIRGIGFRTADALAKRLGISEDSPVRLRAALHFALHELTKEGHVGHPEPGVVEKTVALVSRPPDAIRAAVEPEVAAKKLVRQSIQGEDWLYLPGLHASEVGVARSIRRLAGAAGHPFKGKGDLEKAISRVEAKQKVTLAPAQREAIRLACEHHLVVVTGGPGVGKTTLVRCLLALFRQQDLRCVLAAPTGRAAKRMAEATNHEAKTIHRLLEFDPIEGGFRRNFEVALEGDLFVFDEASMLDCPLANSLFRAIPTGSAVIVVGDIDQLPSVGPGTVLADLIASGAAPVVRLTQIFRQSEGSRIVAAAHAINDGRLPEPHTDARLTDFYFTEVEDPLMIQELVVRLVRDRIPARFSFNPKADVQVLTPMHRGEIGDRNLNQVLQAALNPSADGPEVARFGWTYRVGDRVLQTENNYDRDVFNGDLGVVDAVVEEDELMIVDFEGRKVVYEYNDLDELSLAYCLTIHKSQGSEYPCVVIPLHTQHFPLLQRNLLYTGVTRGRKLVVVVGSRRAFLLAVGRLDVRRRYSALLQRLQGRF